MRKLDLYFDEYLQGKFSPKKLNLLLMFQVNCPGCFFYALPIFNELYAKYNDQFGFIALSTAFEDFDLNTIENTTSLIAHGELVGETKRALNQQGHQKLPYQIDFPVAMDSKLVPDQKTELVKKICELNPTFCTWSEFDKDLMERNVLKHLDGQPEVSLTFTANQFRGTPTLVLFNDKNELLNSWLGHAHLDEIVSKIEMHIG